MAIHAPLFASAATDQCVKSGSDAKALEQITSKGCSMLSTLACKPARLLSFKASAACFMNAAFLATVSTQVTANVGQQMAMTTPGKPAPEPTSSSRTPCSSAI